MLALFGTFLQQVKKDLAEVLKPVQPTNSTEQAEKLYMSPRPCRGIRHTSSWGACGLVEHHVDALFATDQLGDPEVPAKEHSM